jgi:hypothetical protein
MDFPLSTGQVGLLLGTTEARLNDLIRRAKVSPAPPIAAGRRLWHRTHVEHAARVLGVGRHLLAHDHRADADAAGSTRTRPRSQS